MLTPKFSLRQNADFLFIQLHVPFIKTENAECDANGDEFYFSAKPYYLRLHLPGNVMNDDRLKSEYDVDSGDLNIRVPKEVSGQKFTGLDMLTKLLTPKQPAAIPNIEVINVPENKRDDDSCESCEKESGPDLGYGNDDKSAAEELDFDWFIEQKATEDECGIKINNETLNYGFAHLKCNVIGAVCSEIDAIDLKDPDNVHVSERTLLRTKQEDDNFDCEHYLADLFDDDLLIQNIFAPEYSILTGVGSMSEEAFFTDSEKERLMKLPRREYLIDQDKIMQVCLGLVDLVYAYSYNYRFCGGEFNVESDWNICKLSATLSWLDSFHNLKDVVISCARRTLCFPLYRSWKLFEKVFSDVKCVFKSGKRQILKCLLGIHCVLETSESRYILNDLYITDYCVWIQSLDCIVIDSLTLNLSNLEIFKGDVGLSIMDIEVDTEKLMAECPSDDEGIDELARKMTNVVHIANEDNADSDDDDDDDDGQEEDSDDDDDDDDDDGEEEEEEDDRDEEDGIEHNNKSKIKSG